MRSEVPIHLLRPHPKNQDYFSGLPLEKYGEIRRSIEAHGIRDPLKVLPDYTVVAGHQRLKIALELGLDKVPVVVLDIPPEEAEYLLIADNEERRQADDDPIKKARRAKFLAEYWDIERGGDRRSNRQNGGLKTVADVAKAVGESKRTTERILKLNDLIEPLQKLVSAQKLSQTAAHSLAFLPPEEQEDLLKALGSSGVCGLSVKDAQKLRAELDAARTEKDGLMSRLAKLEGEKSALGRELANLQDAFSSAEEQIAEKLGHRYEEKLQEALSGLQRKLEQKQAEADELRARMKEIKQTPVQKIVEKIVYQTDPALETELEATRKQAAELLEKKEWFESRFQQVAKEKASREITIQALKDETEQLKKWLDHARTELAKEKNRPKPPQWSKDHLDFRAAMENASRSAASLAEALARMEEKHVDRLLSASRVRGAPDLEEMAETMGDALLFRTFYASLNMATGRIGRVWDLLEPAKPKLQLIKGKEGARDEET